jgi:hypothetical protein
MRTAQELLEYVDRIIDIGVDKTESGSQFALIELQPASGNQPLVSNADEHDGIDGHGI